MVAKTLTGHIIKKGGTGSGNFSHAGRPGEVGGSSASKYAFEDNVNFTKNAAFNPPDNYIIAIHTTKPKNVPSILQNGIVPGYNIKGSSWNTVADSDNVWFWRDVENSDKFKDWQSKTESVVIFAVPDTVWKDPDGSHASMYKGTISPEWIYGTINVGKQQKIIIHKGSATSGNHGHKGRIGLVGGSAPDNIINQPTVLGKTHAPTAAELDYARRANGTWADPELNKILNDKMKLRMGLPEDDKQELMGQMRDFSNPLYDNRYPMFAQLPNAFKRAVNNGTPQAIFRSMGAGVWVNYDKGFERPYTVTSLMRPSPEAPSQQSETVSFDNIDDASQYAKDKAFDIVEFTATIETSVDWKTATMDVRGQVKDQIVTQLATDTGVSYDVMNNVIEQWANTSNDNDMRSLAIQKAISEEFGVPMSSWQNKNYNALKKRADDTRADWQKRMDLYDKADAFRNAYNDAHPLDRSDPNYSQNSFKRTHDANVEWQQTQAAEYAASTGNYTIPRLSDILTMVAKPEIASTDLPIKGTTSESTRQIARAVYNNTQKWLSDLGYKPDDEITLFRGIETDKVTAADVGRTVKYRGNASEAWSLSPSVAQVFGNAEFAIKVPIKNILSTSRTGWGCLTEGELIVMGNNNTTAHVILAR